MVAPREAGLSLEAGSMREEEGTPPHVPFIPDLFVPFPGGGDRAGGVRSSWSLTRPPAARSAAHFRTVVTLKRGPSLSLSLSLFPSCSRCPPCPQYITYTCS